MYLAVLPNSSGPCEVCGGQSGAGTGLSPSTSVSPVSIIPPLFHTHPSIYHPRCILFFSQYFSFLCQYHSTIAPYSFIHLPATLYTVFSPSTSVSPVSIIQPLLHTHSSIYQLRCILFFLPVLQFPLSVSFHHRSILIHPSTSYAVYCFFSQYFSFPCHYHSTIVPYSSIHLPPTLYNVFLPVL